MELPYNPQDKNSIIEFAKLLIGKSILTQYSNEIEKLNINSQDKGRLGKVIEELYFSYKPNSSPLADFKNAGLELKAAGLNKLKRNKGYSAKERLVLSRINYEEAIKKDFENDFLKGKNGHLLLIFYLYEKGLNILESIIKLVGDWNYPSEDLEIIRQDFENIKKKIQEGKAHELSEGDTFYLGACTKAQNSAKLVKQPYNSILAKPRAYSLKLSYVNHIIASISGNYPENYGKFISDREIAKKTPVEEIVRLKFSKFFGKSLFEIYNSLNIPLSNGSKSDYANLTKRILGLKSSQNIEEFSKANIEIKSIRVEKNNHIEQSISFPAFEFIDIYNQSWDDSELKEISEKKFLFIFFKNNGKEYVLEKVKFWNMPFEDRKEFRKIFLKTKKIIQAGEIFKKYSKNKKGEFIYNPKTAEKRKENFFPKSKDSYIAHVRPHGKNSLQTFRLPVMEKTLQVWEYSKQCFWIKNKYIETEIYLK